MAAKNPDIIDRISRNDRDVQVLRKELAYHHHDTVLDAFVGSSAQTWLSLGSGVFDIGGISAAADSAAAYDSSPSIDFAENTSWVVVANLTGNAAGADCGLLDIGSDKTISGDAWGLARVQISLALTASGFSPAAVSQAETVVFTDTGGFSFAVGTTMVIPQGGSLVIGVEVVNALSGEGISAPVTVGVHGTRFR